MRPLGCASLRGPSARAGDCRSRGVESGAAPRSRRLFSLSVFSASGLLGEGARAPPGPLGNGKDRRPEAGLGVAPGVRRGGPAPRLRAALRPPHPHPHPHPGPEPGRASPVSPRCPESPPASSPAFRSCLSLTKARDAAGHRRGGGEQGQDCAMPAWRAQQLGQPAEGSPTQREVDKTVVGKGSVSWERASWVSRCHRGKTVHSEDAFTARD
jgi:hypothetical protein